MVDLGAPTEVSDVRVSWYDDGGGVRTPDSFDLQYQDESAPGAMFPGRNVCRQRRSMVSPAG